MDEIDPPLDGEAPDEGLPAAATNGHGPVFEKGKYAGQPVGAADQGYLRMVIQQPRKPLDMAQEVWDACHAEWNRRRGIITDITVQSTPAAPERVRKPVAVLRMPCGHLPDDCRPTEDGETYCHSCKLLSELELQMEQPVSGATMTAVRRWERALRKEHGI